jgi:hypothetical protein
MQCGHLVRQHLLQARSARRTLAFAFTMSGLSRTVSTSQGRWRMLSAVAATSSLPTPTRILFATHISAHPDTLQGLDGARNAHRRLLRGASSPA